jgi:hypothetical protein
MSEATISTEVFESLLLESKKSQFTEEANKFSTRTLVWLALPPFWQLSLAKQDFPINETEFIKGDEVRTLLDSVVKARFVETDSATGKDDSVSYWMTPLQRQSLIEQIISGVIYTGDLTPMGYLQRETAEIGRHILRLSEPNELSPILRRWASLAELLGDFRDLSEFFGHQIEDALRDAREAAQTAAPEVLRWLEAFAPFVEIYGSSLEVALTRARREYEIFNRQAYDQRYLTSYLVRDEQDNALLDLLNQPDDENAPWALHYVGAGGVGKTMLMRHINAHLSPKHNLAIARIDFDYLNPDYPAKQPGLLLLGFAVELKKYLGDSYGFQRFEKQVLERHEDFRSTSNTADFVDVQSEPWSYFIRAFAGECRRLSEIGMRPLLILDTCEELVKLRPNGTLPQSVRVTFDILEEIHRLMPSMRVIFAGRRPLAGIGYGWRLRNNELYSNKLLERDYLMLHVIRGFNYDETQAFLSNYKKGQVPKGLFEAILARSRDIREESDQPFLFDDNERGASNDIQTKTDEGNRFNPFDLDLYADWTVSEPDLDEKKLIAGAHFYVKERIVGRVNSQLRKLLPALVLLGRFDEAMLRELSGKDETDFNLLFEELIDQEWIDTERSVSTFETAMGTSVTDDAPENRSLSVWAIDQNMRERLLSYYQSESFSELSTARESVAPLLSKITIEREWHDLSIAYFEAAAQVLTELNKERAADWWEKVEARVADTERWDWAYALTSQLLATGGVAESKERDKSRTIRVSENAEGAENILRPAILATYAAALTHTKPQDLKDVWLEVKEKAHLHPTDAGRYWLSKRAAFGLFAAAVADSKGITREAFENLINEFKPELIDREPLKSGTFRGSQLQASLIAVIEKVAERCELLFGEFHEPVNLSSIAQDVFLWTTDLPDELSNFYGLLKQKLVRLGSNLPASENDHMRISVAIILERNQRWLDWRAPDDFNAREKLEYVRTVYPRSRNPVEALEGVGDPPARLDTIDAERLASAFLTLKWHGGLNIDTDVDEEKIEASLSLAKKISTVSQSLNEAFFVNAHRAFPPYFIVALETQAMSGKLSATVKRIDSISKEAERDKNFIIRQETERLLARLAFHFRLRDERGVGFGAGLRTSEDLEDVKLCSMLDSLDGGVLEQRYWQDLISNSDRRKQAALLHFRYRSSPQLLNPRIIENIKSDDNGENRFEFTSTELLDANIFESLIVFDDVEYNLRKEEKTSLSQSRLSDLNKLKPTDFAFHSLLSTINEESPFNANKSIETINLYEIQSNDDKRPSEESIKLIGVRQAAAIMLEEGTLLTVRHPKAAMPLLRKASRLYKQCKDTCGELLAELTIALVAIKINEHNHLNNALRKLAPVYDELIKSEPGLPGNEDLVLFLDTVEKDNDPTRIFGDFFDKYTDNLYWRPILARLVYCIARDREFDGQGPLTSTIKTWLRVNYARAAGGDQPLFPQEFVFRDQNADRSEQETNFWDLFTRYLSYVFFGSLMAGYFYVVSSEPYLLLMALVFIGCVFLVWWLRHFELNVFVSTTEIPANLNLPLSVPHKVRSEAVQWLFNFVFKETKQIDQSSENNYFSLPEIFNKAFRNFLTIAKFRIGLLATTIIFENTNSVAAPWEAALGLGIKGFHKTRLIFRRMLQNAYFPRTGDMYSPIGICNWAADNSLLDSVYEGWSSLATIEDFQYSGCIPSNIKKAQNNKNVCILHLVGLPIETPYGMRLEIISVETEAQETPGSTDVSDKPEERIISVEKINREFPNLRVCIVQLPPRLEEPRSLTGRTEIAKLRRFCADIFQSGVGAVILLPAVSQELSIHCVETLAKFIVRTDEEQTGAENQIVNHEANINTIDNLRSKLTVYAIISFFCGIFLPALLAYIVLSGVRLFLAIPLLIRSAERQRSTSGEKWMRAVYSVQELIAQKGHSNEDAASEMAFDVCLYLHDEFTWRFHK